MIRFISKFNEAAQTYMIHRSKSKVQFHEIARIKELLIEISERVLVIIDYKQKRFQWS